MSAHAALTGVANDLLGDCKCRAWKNFRSYVDQSSSHVRSVVKPQQPAPTNQPTKLTDTHTHSHTFDGPFSGTTRVSQYQKGKTNLDFNEARDSE